MEALSVTGVSKSYGRRRVALREVSLTVGGGELFGILGPNGAGKTTLFRVVCGLIGADAGVVRVMGRVVDRRRTPPGVGGTVEASAFLPHLTGVENLSVLERMAARGTGRALRVASALESVGLGPKSHLPVRAYSQGMRQRLALAAAIVSEPRLLLLDEPTNGLDPDGKEEVLRLIRGLVDRGITVLFASHQLHEVERICDRVAILIEGGVRASGSLEDLTAGMPVALTIRTRDDARTAELLRARFGFTVERLGEAAGLSLSLADDASPDEVLGFLATSKVEISSAVVGSGGLASVYFSLTGGESGD